MALARPEIAMLSKRVLTWFVVFDFVNAVLYCVRGNVPLTAFMALSGLVTYWCVSEQDDTE